MCEDIYIKNFKTIKIKFQMNHCSTGAASGMYKNQY